MEAWGRNRHLRRDADALSVIHFPTQVFINKKNKLLLITDHLKLFYPQQRLNFSKNHHLEPLLTVPLRTVGPTPSVTA